MIKMLKSSVFGTQGTGSNLKSVTWLVMRLQVYLLSKPIFSINEMENFLKEKIILPPPKVFAKVNKAPSQYRN